jgi:hypothetical protein
MDHLWTLLAECLVISSRLSIVYFTFASKSCASVDTSNKKGRKRIKLVFGFWVKESKSEKIFIHDKKAFWKDQQKESHSQSTDGEFLSSKRRDPCYFLQRNILSDVHPDNFDSLLRQEQIKKTARNIDPVKQDDDTDRETLTDP